MAQAMMEVQWIAVSFPEVTWFIPPLSLTIIPRARMGYESIAHKAEGRMGY